jgi:2,4-dienoyl-CoA reductase-like NADH-dependent reductase (Old Yellow Enzyme family)
MSNIVEPLFAPYRLKGLDLRNRIVMAPMTRSRACDGIPNEDTAAYYRRRAAGEVGLILSEGTVIDRPCARNEPNVPSFHGEAALHGWQTVIDEVHAVGGAHGAATVACWRCA